MRCSTCHHAISAPPADPKWPAGFLGCRHLDKWIYRSPDAACLFEPSRWETA